jgi:hypothetical protein
MLGGSSEQQRVTDAFACLDRNSRVTLLLCKHKRIQVGQRLIDYDRF